MNDRTQGRDKRFRKTQNISFTPDDLRFAWAQAEQFHGGNVSRYIRTLIRRDQLEQSQRAQQRTEAAA